MRGSGRFGSIGNDLEETTLEIELLNTVDKPFTQVHTKEKNRKRKRTMGDRTQFIPSHVGYNVLPSLQFFHRLLRFAQKKPSRISIRDVKAGLEKTFHDVLSDALALRSELEKVLSPQTLRELAQDKEVFIGLLAPGGYEYTVGFVAILALGAAVVPMCKSTKLLDRFIEES